MKTLKTQVLIIGGGAAGLNAVLNLKTSDVILIEKKTSASLFSPWNLMVKPKEKLREEMLKAGNYLNNLELVDAFLETYLQPLEDLRRIGIKFRKSNIGVVPNYSLPGFQVRKIFLSKLKEKGIKILKGKVEKFLIDEKGKIRGVKATLFKKDEKVKIFFNYLILAAGGLRDFFQYTTGSRDCDGSILSLCYEIGLPITNIEFFMFHPFLISDKRLPNVLLSGEILTKMVYENEKGEQFLSKEIANALKTDQFHSLFPQMTREFYLQSLKGKIFGRLICSEKWFEKFKKENEFGFIFKNFKKDQIEKIEFHPAFHFSIGGLVINKNAQTVQEHVYAAGEITGGLHGANRIGGLAVLEALVFSKRAALDINKKMEKGKKKVSIPKKIKIVGKLGLSEEIKKKVWETLGPVKEKSKLENFLKFLVSRKNKTSQEKLLTKIVQICLLRKESVGAFYRSDLKEAKTAPSSFLINKKIIFK